MVCHNFYSRYDRLIQTVGAVAACDNAGLVSSLTLGVVWAGGHWGSRLLLTLAHGARGRSQSQWAAWDWPASEARRGRPVPRPTPTIRAGQPGQQRGLKLWARVVVAVVTRLQRRPAEERGERSPRPVTLQATPVPTGLGPHSLTPTTLFVTLQRISCNIFLPPEIKQSGSNLRLICRRKITSY